MKRTFSATLLLLCAPIVSRAADQLVPAGLIVTCSVCEERISSKTPAIGDPVLRTLKPVEKYGRSMLPCGAYMEGRFEDYKDPGHLVGKGWSARDGRQGMVGKGWWARDGGQGMDAADV